MPVLDGLAATRALLGPERVEGHTPRVLMLTTFDLDDYIYAALEAGASGFLLKDSEPEDLLRAVPRSPGRCSSPSRPPRRT